MVVVVVEGGTDGGIVAGVVVLRRSLWAPVAQVNEVAEVSFETLLK